MADLENLRDPSDEALERFSDSAGYSPYTHRAHLRWRALAFYLWMFAVYGHVKAAVVTCEKYGHEPRGARCERCGMPTR